MLDEFLTAAYEIKSADDQRTQLVEAMKSLPDDELHKIASGEVKLACFDGDNDWLDKFKGTSLYQQALDIETRLLEADIAEQEQRSASRSMNDELWTKRDALRLEKRKLELELRQEEATGGEGEGSDEPPVEVDPDAVAEEAVEEAEPAEEKAASAAAKVRKALGRGKELLTGSKLTKLQDRARHHEGKSAVQGMRDTKMQRYTQKLEGDKLDATATYTTFGGSRQSGRSTSTFPTKEDARNAAGSKLHKEFMRAGRHGKAGDRLKTLAEQERKNVRNARIGAGGAGGALLATGTVAATRAKRGKGATDKEAAAKLAAGQMTPLLAKRILENDIDRGSTILPYEPTDDDYASAGQAARTLAGQTHAGLEDEAAWTEEHPVLNKLRGAAYGAVPGALLGGALGVSGPHPSGGLRSMARGALAGGVAMGGLSALLTPGAAARRARADQYGAAAGAMGDEDYTQAVRQWYGQNAAQAEHDRAVEVAQAGAPNISQTTNVGGGDDPYARYRRNKYASVYERNLEVLAELEKEAVIGALTTAAKGLRAALPGAKATLGAGAKNVAGAYRGAGGGMAGLRSAASMGRNVAGDTARMAGDWASKNRGSAALAGGGALLGAGAVGYGMRGNGR